MQWKERLWWWLHLSFSSDTRTTPLCDPQSQKPQRASYQSDKTELSWSVCTETENSLSVCISIYLSILPSFFFFSPSFLPSGHHSFLLTFLSSFHLSFLHPFLSFCHPYFFSFHPSVLPFYSSSLPLSFLSPFFTLSVPPFLHPFLCLMVWTQLPALHTFCSMWLQPRVLLLFGQCRHNQFCVKCGFTLGSTLIGVSTQAGFQLPAQMWLCLLCRPFKSDCDLMNRWEQAHQIWAGGTNLACVDWHTNQQRTEWECVFVTEKAVCSFKCDAQATMCQVSILFLCFKLILYQFLSKQENSVSFCFSDTLKETKTSHVTCRWEKWRVWSSS